MAANEDYEVDFLIQELEKKGLEVKYDRVVLLAGLPLWDQLEKQIDWDNIDAWAIYTTKQSLESEPCRGELSYALNLALRIGRAKFPLIGVFPEPVDHNCIPKAISSRLYVTLDNPNAVQAIVDGVNGENTKPQNDVNPIGFKWLPNIEGTALGLEFWPRMGAFSRIFVGLSDVKVGGGFRGGYHALGFEVIQVPKRVPREM